MKEDNLLQEHIIIHHNMMPHTSSVARGCSTSQPTPHGKGHPNSGTHITNRNSINHIYFVVIQGLTFLRENTFRRL